MEIANPNGELSMMTFVTGGKGYVQIYSGLSVSDATRFRKDIIVLHDMGIVEVEIYINSPGGDAFTGLAVADEIERAKLKGMKITAVASGIVASAAVPVFAACDKRVASPGTIFMVHESALWKWPGRETASDIRSQNDLMALLRERYLGMLADNSVLTAEQWGEMEGKTTWFSSEKAREYGLVDEIY
jgi:ATP-dependent Clp protease protease subunit